VSITRDGTKLLTASIDELRIWSLGTGQLLRSLKAASGVFTAVFDPGGRRIVAAGDDGTAVIWDAGDGRPIGAVSEPGGAGLTSAGFSADGQRVVTTSQDGSARIWDTSSDAPLAALNEPGGATIWSAEFNPGGRTLVTASQDGFLRVWDIASGRQLTAIGAGTGLTDVSLSPDGRRVVVANGPATVFSMELAGPLGAIEQLARSRLTRTLTSAERALYLAGIG
jgi:WD40 repeat protein